jgi:hypothetical protein
MHNPVVQAEFDGVARDGREFVIRVAIGDKRSSGDDVSFYVEVEPLIARRYPQGGTDTLMAMCFCIQGVRRVLKMFVAHGGSVYGRGTRSPVDLDSYWFEPVGDDKTLRAEFLLPSPKEPPAKARQAKRRAGGR